MIVVVSTKDKLGSHSREPEDANECNRSLFAPDDPSTKDWFDASRILKPILDNW